MRAKVEIDNLKRMELELGGALWRTIHMEYPELEGVQCSIDATTGVITVNDGGDEGEVSQFFKTLQEAVSKDGDL